MTHLAMAAAVRSAHRNEISAGRAAIGAGDPIAAWSHLGHATAPVPTDLVEILEGAP